MDFDPRDYVSPEEGRRRFPDDVAVIAHCYICNRPLLLAPGDAADCGMHAN